MMFLFLADGVKILIEFIYNLGRFVIGLAVKDQFLGQSVIILCSFYIFHMFP